MFSIISRRDRRHVSSQELCGSVTGLPYFVERLKLDRKLEVHNGCVNTVCWNDNGTLLLSGSDDQHLVVCDPFTGKIVTKVRSGHRSNIFCARFLPGSLDREVVSCSGSGEIFYTDLDREDLLDAYRFGCHFGTTYKIVVVPNEASTFLSCGDDGTVRFFDLRVKTSCSKLNCEEDVIINLQNSISSLAVDPVIPYQLALGAADGMVRIYDRRMLKAREKGSNSKSLICVFQSPMSKTEKRHFRITSLNYRPGSHDVLVNYSSENIYLFNTYDVDTTQKYSVEVPKASSNKKLVNLDDATLGSGSAESVDMDEYLGVPAEDRRNPSSLYRPIRRLRLRGDWSDTGPNARPENEGQAPTSMIMQRMSDLLTRMLNTNINEPSTSQGSSLNRTHAADDPGMTAANNAHGGSVQHVVPHDSFSSYSPVEEQSASSKGSVSLELSPHDYPVCERNSEETLQKGNNDSDHSELAASSTIHKEEVLNSDPLSNENLLEKECDIVGEEPQSFHLETDVETSQENNSDVENHIITKGSCLKGNEEVEESKYCCEEHHLPTHSSQSDKEIVDKNDGRVFPNPLPSSNDSCITHKNHSLSIRKTGNEEQMDRSTINKGQSCDITECVEIDLCGKGKDSPLSNSFTNTHRLKCQCEEGETHTSGIQDNSDVSPSNQNKRNDSIIIGKSHICSDGDLGSHKPLTEPSSGNTNVALSSSTVKIVSNLSTLSTSTSGPDKTFAIASNTLISDDNSQPTLTSTSFLSSLSGESLERISEIPTKDEKQTERTELGFSIENRNSTETEQQRQQQQQASHLQLPQKTSVSFKSKMADNVNPLLMPGETEKGMCYDLVEAYAEKGNLKLDGIEFIGHPLEPVTEENPLQYKAVAHKEICESCASENFQESDRMNIESASNLLTSKNRYTPPITADSFDGRSSVAYSGKGKGVGKSSKKLQKEENSDLQPSVTAPYNDGNVKFATPEKNYNTQSSDFADKDRSSQPSVTSTSPTLSLEATWSLNLTSTTTASEDDEGNRIKGTVLESSTALKPSHNPSPCDCVPFTSVDDRMGELPGPSQSGGQTGRQRRVGYSLPPTGNFQLHSDDDDDNENEDTTRVRRSKPSKSHAARKIQELFRKRRHAKENAHLLNLPQPRVISKFSGHRNCRTMIKESNFYGDAYVIGGSDCGRIFIWERLSGRLAMYLEADKHVVNCVQPNPHLPLIASSGIDYDIKLWSPSAEESRFDPDVANVIVQRNELMLLETRDTITVPPALMLRVLASLSHIRAGRTSTSATVPQAESEQHQDSPPSAGGD